MSAASGNSSKITITTRAGLPTSICSASGFWLGVISIEVGLRKKKTARITRGAGVRMSMKVFGNRHLS